MRSNILLQSPPPSPASSLRRIHHFNDSSPFGHDMVRQCDSITENISVVPVVFIGATLGIQVEDTIDTQGLQQGDTVVVARSMRCNLHHAAKPCPLWLCTICSYPDDASPLRNVVRLKPAPRLAERPVCSRFGACVMSVLFQGGGAFWTNTIFPLQTTSTAARRPAPEFGNRRRRRWPARTAYIAQLPIPGCIVRSPEFTKCTSATTRAGWSRNGFSSRRQTGGRRCVSPQSGRNE